MPQTKTAASPSPSPARNNCRPGHPPPRAKASPASVMPAKFQNPMVCATGWGKTGVELAQDQVGDESGGQKGGKAHEEMGLLEKNQIPKSAHGAEPAALGQEADSQAHDQRNGQRGMQGAGSFDAVEQDTTLVLLRDLGEYQHQYQEAEHGQRQQPTDG
jgi:hypothetical protein